MCFRQMVALLVWDHIQSVRCNDCWTSRVAILVWDQIYWLADSTIQIHGWWANTNSEAVVWNVVCRISIHICVNWCNFSKIILHTYIYFVLCTFVFIWISVCICVNWWVNCRRTEQAICTCNATAPHLPICSKQPQPSNLSISTNT